MTFPNIAYLGSNQAPQGGWLLEGTEMRNALYAGGTLYLGNGMWEQPHGSGPIGYGNGAQILAQYAPPSGPVVIEAQLPQADLCVASLASANFASSKAWKTCAGTWTTEGLGRVYTRYPGTRSWVGTTIWANGTGKTAQVRSMLSYTDQKTHQSRLFAGTSDASGVVGGVYAGAYDPHAAGDIVWGEKAELAMTDAVQGVVLPLGCTPRVTSFAQFTDATGVPALYCTIGPRIFKRIDGDNPTWESVWTHVPESNEHSQTGLRALTPFGKFLYVSVEGTKWAIVRLDPNNGFAATPEYTKQDLDAALGPGFTVTYIIGPYNGLRPVQVGSTWYMLIGMVVLVSRYPAGTPIYTVPSQGAHILATAHYLVKKGPQYILKTMDEVGSYPSESVRDFAVVGGNVVGVGFDCWIAPAPGHTSWAVWDSAANAVAAA